MGALEALLTGIFAWPAGLANAWIYAVSSAPTLDIVLLVILTVATALHINFVAHEFAKKVGDGLWELGPHVIFTNAGATLMYILMPISVILYNMSSRPASEAVINIMFLSFPAATFWGIAMGVIRGLLEESGELEGDGFTLHMGTSIMAIIVAVYLVLTLPWPWNIVVGVIGIASPILHEYISRKYNDRDFVLF